MFRGKWGYPTRQWLSVVLAAVAVAFLVWASTSAASYEVCQDDRHASHPDKKNLSQEIAYFAVCEGVAIDANGELLTALATIIMAVFTGTLWLVTGNAVDLAQQEFVSTHRPKIRLRRLRLESPIVGQPLIIMYDLVNIGDTRATIVSTGLFMRMMAVNQIPEMDWGEILPSNKTISGGEVLEESRNTHHDCPPSIAFFDQRLRVGGEIRYMDDNGVTRRTGFLRIADAHGGSLFRQRDVIDAELEYED